MPSRNSDPSSPSIWSPSKGGFPRQKAASRDQRKLLDRQDAWASKLQNSQSGLVNVPIQVIDHIVAFNSRTTQRSQNAEPAAERDTNTDNGGSSTGSSPLSRSSHRISTLQRNEDNIAPSLASSPSKSSDGRLEMLKRKRSVIGSQNSSPSELENAPETDIPGPQTREGSKRQRTSGLGSPIHSRYSSADYSPTRDADEDQTSPALDSPVRRQPRHEVEDESRVTVQPPGSSLVSPSRVNGSAKKRLALESPRPDLPPLRPNGPVAVTQSTSGSESDLEMTIPRAFNSRGKSVNRSSAAGGPNNPIEAAERSTNTIPCGQPAACSAPAQPAPTKHSPQNNPRRMKPVKFSESPQLAPAGRTVFVPSSFARVPTPMMAPPTSSAIATSDPLRLSPRAPVLAANADYAGRLDTLSRKELHFVDGTGVTPSCSPQESQVVTDTSQETPPVEGESAISLTPICPSHQAPAIANQNVPVEEAAFIPPGSATAFPDGTYVKERRIETTFFRESVARDKERYTQTAAAPPLTPFDAFVSVYSTYQGSLDVFVKACMYLKVLKRRRALSEFLYDDFIRAFSDGYLDYVSGFEESKSPLPAIAWYNSTVKEPEYKCLVFDGDSLEEVLSTYSEQVNEVRAHMGSSALNSQDSDENTTAGLAGATSVATTPKAHLIEPRSVSTQTDQGQWESVSMQTDPEENRASEADQREVNAITEQRRDLRSVSTQTEEVKVLDPREAAEDGVVATPAKHSVFDSPRRATSGTLSKNLTPTTRWKFDAPQAATSAGTSDRPISWSEKGTSTIRALDLTLQDEAPPSVPLVHEKPPQPTPSTPAQRKVSNGLSDTPQPRSAASTKSKENSTPSSAGKKYLGSDYLRQLSQRSAVGKEGKRSRPKHQRLTEYLEKYMKEKHALASGGKPQGE